MGAGELLLIFVAVLLLFGSKNLPKTARMLGRLLEEFRRTARDVSREIMQADAPSGTERPTPEKKEGGAP